MSFIKLKLSVWIDQRIFVIEPCDVTDVEHAILHAVDPATAVSLRIGGKTERVRDATRGIPIVRQLPQLFHADAVNLWFTSFGESESFNQLFSQRSSGTFAEHRHFRPQVDAGFE